MTDPQEPYTKPLRVDENSPDDIRDADGNFVAECPNAVIAAALVAAVNEAGEIEQMWDYLESQIMHIADRLEDEGDRIYLGSTNDADILRGIAHEHFERKYLPPVERARALTREKENG